MNGIKAVINSFIFKNDSQSCSKSKLNKVVSLAIATISLVGAALAACPKQVFDSIVTIIRNISKSTTRNVDAKAKQIILGDCSVPANTVSIALPTKNGNTDSVETHTTDNEIAKRAAIGPISYKSAEIDSDGRDFQANDGKINQDALSETHSSLVVEKKAEIVVGNAHKDTAMREIESPKNTIQVPKSSPSFKFNKDNYSWSVKDDKLSVENLKKLVNDHDVFILNLKINYHTFKDLPAKFASYYISHTENVPFYEIFFLVNGRRWDNPEVCIPTNVDRYNASISYNTDRFNLSDEDKKAIHKFLGMFLYMAQLGKLTEPASISLSYFKQIKKLKQNINPADLEKSPILKSFFADVEFLRIEVKRLIKVSRAKSARK